MPSVKIAILYLIAWVVVPSTFYANEPSTFRNGSRTVWLEFNGTSNTRDAGGYLARDGTRIKKGLIYRSDRLAALTETDCILLRNTGVRAVIDLRSDGEILDVPDPACLTDFARYIHHPIVIRSLSTYEEIYIDIVTTFAPSIKEVFHRIADPGNLPVLYHCTAGKDRTGIITALLHVLLGVSRDDVMYDYLLSLDAGYWVEASWLQAVLDLVDQEGGIETFLLNREVDLVAQNAIREHLLEDASCIEGWEFD
ncbi:MAG: tyrosine-protein phosphatase [Candidatus Omnitrophota bacterium]|jgi:protein tyrosine phosphatase (PTP) superfamily phosphohydrolase (DUF442 family)|nr:MAG: tyrosine-protein phosphatase [Candidatus Omnitrophota bacterium]